MLLLWQELFTKKLRDGGGAEESNPTLAEDARVGALRVRQESCRWDPTGASGRSSQVGKDGYFSAGGRSFELETILLNVELARFAIIDLLGLRFGGGNLVLGTFCHGDSEFSELRLQLFEAEKRTSRSVDIVSRGSHGLSRHDFGPRVASVEG